MTGGGLSLREVDAHFQFQGCPGLYFVGETLDCAGSCGGFNLHWAFGSGIAAGRDAARRVQRQRKNSRPGAEMMSGTAAYCCRSVHRQVTKHHYVLVHPDYQGKGIAGEMLKRIKEKYKNYL